MIDMVLAGGLIIGLYFVALFYIAAIDLIMMVPVTLVKWLYKKLKTYK